MNLVVSVNDKINWHLEVTTLGPLSCYAPINVKPQGGGGGGGGATHGKLTERAFPRVGNLTWPPSWKTERHWK